MESRPQLWPAARVAFAGSLILFTTTVVIGILNGIDAYRPDRDTLMGHVHAGTLGWITLALAGVILVAFTRDRILPDSEVRRAVTLAWTLTIASALFAAAFFVGDRIPGDRIQRPIVGSILMVVLVWFGVWMVRNGRAGVRTVAKLGLLLAWTSLVIGAVFGVILGLVLSEGEVPGLSAKTAIAVADAHPPAMVIGFLIVAALSMIEWLLGDRTIAASRSGAVQMWLLFGAGIVVNVAFLASLDDVLLGPANVAMIVGVIMVIVRRRDDLRPSVWRDRSPAAFGRISAAYLVVYLVVLTIIVVKVLSESIDIEALSPEDEGLMIAWDHLMSVGVMTNALFGALALLLHGRVATTVDRVLVWGLGVGVAGFAAGLIMVEALPKRIFTPIMGAALLIGIVAYLREIIGSRTPDRA
ncbi:MAG: hypothetical protein HZA58_06460 [Acidimicrobiia bacterium]|nr:hypothetical protein [Acidimicrobiia bacterium]